MKGALAQACVARSSKLLLLQSYPVTVLSPDNLSTTSSICVRVHHQMHDMLV